MSVTSRVFQVSSKLDWLCFVSFPQEMWRICINLHRNVYTYSWSWSSAGLKQLFFPKTTAFFVSVAVSFVIYSSLTCLVYSLQWMLSHICHTLLPRQSETNQNWNCYHVIIMWMGVNVLFSQLCELIHVKSFVLSNSHSFKKSQMYREQTNYKFSVNICIMLLW